MLLITFIDRLSTFLLILPILAWENARLGYEFG